MRSAAPDGIHRVEKLPTMQRSRIRRKPITAAQGRVADLSDAAQFEKLSKKYSDRLIVLVAYTVISPSENSSCTIFDSGRMSSDAACLSLCPHTETCLCHLQTWHAGCKELRELFKHVSSKAQYSHVVFLEADCEKDSVRVGQSPELNNLPSQANKLSI